MKLPLSEMAMLNAEMARQAFLWRETELPKVREKMLAAGFVPRTAILDNIVTVDELQSDPHEVWVRAWGWCDGWVRVEIEA